MKMWEQIENCKKYYTFQKDNGWDGRYICNTCKAYYDEELSKIKGANFRERYRKFRNKFKFIKGIQGISEVGLVRHLLLHHPEILEKERSNCEHVYKCINCNSFLNSAS